MGRSKTPAFHRSKILILLSLLITSAAGCGVAPVLGNLPEGPRWPPPPERPRISFLKSIYGSYDLQYEDSPWLKRFLTSVVGKIEDKVLLAPYSAATDDDGNVFIVDRDSRDVFSFNLNTGRSRILYYEVDDTSDHPIGIGIAKKLDRIYLTYPNSGRVIELTKKGDFVAEFPVKDILKRPTGIAFNELNHYLYVADTGAHDIKVFDMSGNLKFAFGKRGNKEGEFNFPTHIFIDKEGTVYITDEINFRIQAFTKDGEFVFQFGKAGLVSGTFQNPKGVAVDSDGNIYVADAMADVIQIFDKSGRLLLYFGEGGEGDGQFSNPSGIFIDNNDIIYICDVLNRRISLFRYHKAVK